MLIDHADVFIADTEKIHRHGVTVRVENQSRWPGVSLNMVGFEKYNHLVCLVLGQGIHR